MHQTIGIDRNKDLFAIGRCTLENKFELLPSRLEVFEKVQRALEVAPVVALCGLSGMGRSAIALKIAQTGDGFYLNAHTIIDAIRHQPADRWEEVVLGLVTDGFARKRLVVLDDFPELTSIESHRYFYFGSIIAPMIRDIAVREDARLLFVGQHKELWTNVGELFGSQSLLVEAPAFDVADYRRFFEWHLGEAVADIDFELVHRCASLLDGYQLRLAGNLLRNKEQLNTDAVLDCIEKYVVHGNIRVEEVEALSFDSLPGAEHIAEALETHIILPFEQRQLAQELRVKPKRGVLLYGPPGTGKTSIGRALAHRIQGRFFLIDGRFPTEPPSHFFAAVNQIVAEAKKNSPSVLFIDDADMLFEIEHISGLSRYLLSLLDGIESQTANNVCVMMTAMDPKRVPEPLLRSGRVELWLETKLPDDITRERILKRWMTADLPGNEAIDYGVLSRATAGFTPADLRRLAGDAKVLYAADKATGKKLGKAQDYLRRAVGDLVELRGAMASHLADESLRIGLAGGLSR